MKPCTPDMAETVWDILGQDLDDPHFGITLYGAVYIIPFWDDATQGIVKFYDPRHVWRGLQKALEMGIEETRIRAVCHFLWGQPCFPQKGSLTLVTDHDTPVGALEML